MSEHQTAELIDEFLGSAHVFASAFSSVIEQELLREVDQQVTVAQLKLLKLVSITEAQTIGDVASFLGVSNAAASKGVDKLVRMMLLRRSEAESDRRSIHLSLTQPGKRLVAAYEAARQRKLEQVFAKFDPGELRQAAALLDRLSAQIVHQGAQGEQMCLQCGLYFREKCVMRKLLSRRCCTSSTGRQQAPARNSFFVSIFPCKMKYFRGRSRT
jgi:DNA-binding MarR family transcriptional regulator